MDTETTTTIPTLSASVEGFRNGLPIWMYDITGEEWHDHNAVRRILDAEYGIDADAADDMMWRARMDYIG